MTAPREWLDGLAVGDKVAIRSHAGSWIAEWRIGTVTARSNRGHGTVTVGGAAFDLRNGSARHHPCDILPLTDEARAAIRWWATKQAISRLDATLRNARSPEGRTLAEAEAADAALVALAAAMGLEVLP